jgi:hypothetical protein
MGGIEGMVPQLKPMLVSFAVSMGEKFANADISKKVRTPCFPSERTRAREDDA